MPSGWTLRQGEEFVRAAGHAEEGIISSLGKHDVVEFGGISRNICRDVCYPLLNYPGLVFGGPEFPGRKDKTPWRMFGLAAINAKGWS
jgi:large repetitive protein